MQLSSLDELAKASNKTNFAIFELDKSIDFGEILPKSFHLKPDEQKNIITIDIVRSINELVNTKQEASLIIVVEHADTMNIQAQNAFLKMLEEPKDNIHYVFLCNNIGLLLPTIHSRAYCYYLPSNKHISDVPNADEKQLALAKSYISASAKTIYPIAEKISKLSKDHAKDSALEIIAIAIELMYKSYFKTGNEAYLNKLQQLLQTDKAIRANGNLKLQLVANMI